MAAAKIAAVFPQQSNMAAAQSQVGNYSQLLLKLYYCNYYYYYYIRGVKQTLVKYKVVVKG